jgi:(4-O-methyl)-D-glucuronate---lignin esterase
MNYRAHCLFTIAAMLCALVATTRLVAAEKANYAESEVPEYTLPDPLVAENGQQIKTQQQWHGQRRAQVLKLFEEQVYGIAPGPPDDVRYRELSRNLNALDGRAIRKEIRVLFTGKEDGPFMDILILMPKERPRPIPTFVGLNFAGNHATDPDPTIRLSESWMRAGNKKGIVDNRATEAARGVSASRWPYAMVIERGYALATIYYGDIDPDYDDGFQNGVHPLFYQQGQKRPGPDQWGSISAWAWGLSRAMDYFATDHDIDHQRVAVMGHSRLGKTSLWAGASDPRFALVVSNNSGCGGAALSRRRFGETVGRINRVFPHWFCDNFKQYNDREDQLPIDQHMLIALIAPRPVLICSAEEDRWADPRGEFLSAVGADGVYRLLGTDGIASDKMPPVNQPILSTIGYHIRPGQHDVTAADWKVYLDFADQHMHLLSHASL